MSDTGRPTMLSLPEWAATVGINRQRALVLVKAGRVEGAERVGRAWNIPADAPKPDALPPGRRTGSRAKKPV